MSVGEIFLYGMVAGGLVVGFLTKRITEYQWALSAFNDGLFYNRQKWYKVVDVEEPESWRLFFYNALLRVDGQAGDGEFFSVVEEFCKEMEEIKELNKP